MASPSRRHPAAGLSVFAPPDAHPRRHDDPCASPISIPGQRDEIVEGLLADLVSIRASPGGGRRRSDATGEAAGFVAARHFLDRIRSRRSWFRKPRSLFDLISRFARPLALPPLHPEEVDLSSPAAVACWANTARSTPGRTGAPSARLDKSLNVGSARCPPTC
jgi:hypothetical protein